MSSLFDYQPDNRSYRLCPQYPTTDKVGLEVELENVPRDDVRFKYIRRIEDGSLRDDGAEFIFKNPYCGEDLVNALGEFKGYLGLNPDITCGERTSVHVHVDIRDMTTWQIFKMLTTYLVFEKSIYHMCGPDRYHCNFCQPLAENQHGLEIVGLMNSHSDKYSKGAVENGIVRQGKYSGLNLTSINMMGSIEFRMHEGTKDIDRIENFIKTLLRLKRFAIESEIDPKQYPGFLSEMGTADFCSIVFEDYAVGLFEDPEFNDNCYEGVRNAEFCINFYDMLESTAQVRGHKLVTNKPKRSIPVPNPGRNRPRRAHQVDLGAMLDAAAAGRNDRPRRG